MEAQDLEAGAEGRGPTNQHWSGGGHCEVIGSHFIFLSLVLAHFSFQWIIRHEGQGG